MIGKSKPVAVMRAVVTRTDGTREVHYAHEHVPWWDIVRQLKLRAHLAWMKKEDADGAHDRR